MRSRRVFDVSGVLREALWLPWKDGKLGLSITLLVLLPFSLLVLLHALALGPSMEEIEDKEFSSGNHNVLALVVAELVFVVLFAFLFLFAMAATISFSSSIYSDENDVSLHRLLRRIRAKWKGPAFTFFYSLLIAVVYVFGLTVLLIGASAIVIGGKYYIVGLVGIGLMGFAGTLFFIYLAAIGLLSVVVSVVEDDWHGPRAIARGGEVFEGRKLQVFVLMLVLLLLSAPFHAIFLVNIVDDELSAAVHVVVGTITTILVCLMNLFIFVVFTVFYCKCKRNLDGKEEGEEDSLVSTDLEI